MISKNKTVNFSPKERFRRYLAREELKLEDWRVEEMGNGKDKSNNEIKEFKEFREIKGSFSKKITKLPKFSKFPNFPNLPNLPKTPTPKVP